MAGSIGRAGAGRKDIHPTLPAIPGGTMRNGTIVKGSGNFMPLAGLQDLEPVLALHLQLRRPHVGTHAF